MTGRSCCASCDSGRVLRSWPVTRERAMLLAGYAVCGVSGSIFLQLVFFVEPPKTCRICGGGVRLVSWGVVVVCEKLNRSCWRRLSQSEEELVIEC